MNKREWLEELESAANRAAYDLRYLWLNAPIDVSDLNHRVSNLYQDLQDIEADAGSDLYGLD